MLDSDKSIIYKFWQLIEAIGKVGKFGEFESCNVG